MYSQQIEPARVPVAQTPFIEGRAAEKSPVLWDPRHFREEAAQYGVRVATQHQLAALHQLAEELVGMRLAPLASLAAAHAHTRASAWVYDAADGVSGLILNLPLTAEGEIALILGRFNSSDPELEHLCAPGEPVSAMYIWFTGGRGLRARTAVMRTAFAWRDGFYGGLRAYSRAATTGGARGLASLAFAPLEQRDLGLLFCDKRR